MAAISHERPQHPPHVREELAVVDRLWDVEERADALQEIQHGDHVSLEKRIERIEQVMFGRTETTPSPIHPQPLHADHPMPGAGSMVTDRR